MASVTMYRGLPPRLMTKGTPTPTVMTVMAAKALPMMMVKSIMPRA